METKPSLFSVIIPCKNGGEELRRCLEHMLAQSYPACEIIVVDDGSTDGSACIATDAGAVVLRNPRVGVSAARNWGAQHARGDWLIFTDCDVMWPPELLARLADIVAEGRWDGLTGVQSLDCGYRNFSSMHKNLWMRFTYWRLHERPNLGILYTTLAAIRREMFLQESGFPEDYRRPGIEDTVLGHCLRDRGARMSSHRGLEVQHRRYYNLPELLKTDFLRTRDMTAFLAERGILQTLLGNKTSVPGGFMASVFWSFLLPPCLYVASGGVLGLLVVLGWISGFWFLNREYLAFAARSYDQAFRRNVFLFLLLDIWVVDLGVCFGIAKGLFRKVR